MQRIVAYFLDLLDKWFPSKPTQVAIDFDDTVELKAFQKSMENTFALEAPKAQAPLDPYGQRRENMDQVLGGVAPHEGPTVHSMTPEEANRLDTIARELEQKLAAVRDEFLLAHHDMPFAHQTYVALDASAGLMAGWVCSLKCIEKSDMDIPSGIMSSVELLQHNFTTKQKVLKSQLGHYVH